MSRRLSLRSAIALLFAAGLAPSLFAQSDEAAGPPAQKLDRAQLQRPDMRFRSSRVERNEPLDPKMEKLLQEWSDRTKSIKTLRGDTFRAVIETTFNTEKRTQGKFYFEAPDKGRLDLEPYGDPKTKAVQKRKGPDGKEIQFAIQPGSNEKWICDGQKIRQIDDDAKTYETLDIPKQHQGANIMDGPLPFLFGMPPDKAKQRYSFKLLDDSGPTYKIRVLPKQKEDAASWKMADLQLSKTEFLPVEVHLYDPAGNSETVFYFQHCKVNAFAFPWTPNPFKPMLLGYKPIIPNLPDPKLVQAKLKTDQNQPPQVTGLAWSNAKANCEKLGWKPIPVRGPRATAPEQVFHVMHQEVSGEKQVKLIVYDEMEKTVQRLPEDQQPAQDRRSNRPAEPRGTAKPTMR